MYRIKGSDNRYTHNVYYDLTKTNNQSLLLYIPNILSIARIGLVPWLLVLLQAQQYTLSLVVFVVAGITDGLDGFIAKRFNAQTNLGAILDPLADKALLVSAYVMLSIMELVPFWLMVVVVFRDVVIVGGYLIMRLSFDSIEMRPLLISKANTFIQIAFIILVLVSLSGGLDQIGLMTVLAYLVLLTSVTSGSAYVYIWALKATKDSPAQI